MLKQRISRRTVIKTSLAGFSSVAAGAALPSKPLCAVQNEASAVADADSWAVSDSVNSVYRDGRGRLPRLGDASEVRCVGWLLRHDLASIGR